MSELRIQLPKEMFEPSEFMQIEEPVRIDPIESGPDTFTFDEPADVRITITNTGGAFLIQGEVHTVASSACARCLEDAKSDIDGKIEGYVLIEGESNDLDDLEGDEFESLGEDKTVDLMRFITSAIMLDLPRIPLCDEDCKGICPRCGHDLNEGECDCADEEDLPNNPFSILKDLELND